MVRGVHNETLKKTPLIDFKISFASKSASAVGVGAVFTHTFKSDSFLSVQKSQSCKEEVWNVYSKSSGAVHGIE